MGGSKSTAGSDDRLRNLAEKYRTMAGGVGDLVSKPKEDLFALLAQRVSSPGKDDFRAVYSDDDLLRDDVSVTLGERIFRRWERATYAFLCAPGDEDKNLRSQIARAILSKDGGGAALVAAGLVAAFGLSAAVAAVVAALLIKIVVAPTADELCATWNAKLGATDAKSGNVP